VRFANVETFKLCIWNKISITIFQCTWTYFHSIQLNLIDNIFQKEFKLSIGKKIIMFLFIIRLNLHKSKGIIGCYCF
jgi:hypothetical protein